MEMRHLVKRIFACSLLKTLFSNLKCLNKKILKYFIMNKTIVLKNSEDKHIPVFIHSFIQTINQSVIQSFLNLFMCFKNVIIVNTVFIVIMIILSSLFLRFSLYLVHKS